jgi:adenylate cyclase
MPIEKQATIAVNVALEMIDRIDSFKKKHHLPNLQIGIGIHTGLTTVGMIGFEQRLHYSAVGQTVDTVKAIAGLAHDKSIIIISGSTQEACADDFKFIDLGNHTLPGEPSPITLFEPKRT